MTEVLAQLEASLVQHMVSTVMQSAQLPILQARFRRLPPRPTLTQVCSQQLYLTIVA